MTERRKLSKPCPTLKNEGTFEGFVGKRPQRVENKAGTSQCFLDVGHTPVFMDENGNFVKEKRPVWIHFACFGKLADFAIDCIRVGQRVMVDYKMTARYHPRYGVVPSFQAKLLRPVAKGFDTPEDAPLGESALGWKPVTAKGAERWKKVEEPEPEGLPDEVVDDEDRHDEGEDLVA